MFTIRAAAVGAIVAAVALAPPARADEPAPSAPSRPQAELFRVELSAAWWFPAANIVIASDAAGIRGTDIDFRSDLGLKSGGITGFRISGRPATRHTLRLEYIPIRYESRAVLSRDVVFNGVVYPRGSSVAAAFDWTGLRLDYQYDFLIRGATSVGALIEFRANHVEARLQSSELDEDRRTSVPIPAIGAVARHYVTPRFSLTGELVGLKVPNSADKRYGGYYLAIEACGTINVTRHAGAEVGFRSMDVGHYGATDAGTTTLRGVFVSGVARF